MKKMVLYIVLVFLVVIAINKFTVINLSPKLLFRGSWYKQFPELQDSLQGDKFSMYRVAQTRNVAAAGELKTLAFSKESYTTEGYFNPGIPNTFYGTGYYALHIDSSILHFKTIAYKHNGIGGAIQTDLHLFGLPLAFAKRSQVRFLTYDYGTNFKENGKKGVYVLACVVADFFN